MKYLGPIIVVLILVGGVAYFFPDKYMDAPGIDTPEITKLQEMPQDMSHRPLALNTAPAGVRDEAIAQPGVDAARVTDEQRAIAIQQEDKILDMAREYEAVRSDPEKLHALRAEMKLQLALYSESFLPIAMQEMEPAQAPN